MDFVLNTDAIFGIIARVGAPHCSGEDRKVVVLRKFTLAGFCRRTFERGIFMSWCNQRCL